MEILIEILDTLKDITGPALWVGMGAIFLIFLYKILFIGSIYGVVKFAIQKAHDVLTGDVNKKINYHDKMTGIAIRDHIGYLVDQTKRLRGIRSGSTSYIHETDVDWLREAIDEKLAKEKASEEA